MRMNKLIYCLAFCIVTVAVSGCNPAIYRASKAESGRAMNKIEQKEAMDIPPPAPVVTQSGAYVDTTKISLVRSPSWLKRHITLHGDSLPFGFYVSEILDGTSAMVHFDESVDRKKPTSLDYSGTLRGALDDLATQTNYSYDLDKVNNSITWSAFKIKTFDVSFMPGDARFSLGKSGANLNDANSSDDSVGLDLSEDNQDSQLSGNLSVWGDLEATINSLLSSEGKANVSQSTTTVTVHDHPSNVKAVDKYIRQMNRELSRQVRVQVQVLEVQLNNEFTYGVDWNLIRQVANNTIALVGSNYTNAAVSTLNPIGIGYISPEGSGSRWVGTNTFINALEEQGEVTVVTQPSVVTLNNQVAQISVQDQENYIQEISQTLNENFSTSAVSTGTVTTGMTLFLLPKIKNNEVFLQLSTTLSSLLSLDKINTQTGVVSATRDDSINSSNTSDNPSDTGTGNATGTGDTESQPVGPSYVQLPKINARTINQRALIPSGATLILAGFKQLNSENKLSKFFTSEALGGKGGTHNNVEIVFLITPTVLTSDLELEDMA